MKLPLLFFSLLVCGLSACGPGGLPRASGNTNPAQTRPATGSETGRWEERRLEGVDFIALGQNMDWSLEIDFEKQLIFRSERENHTLDQALPVVENAENTMVYEVKTENPGLTIRIAEQFCRENLSQNRFTHSVTVTLNGRQLSGCGSYLAHKDLDGIWALQTLNNQNLNAAELAQGLPTMQLRLHNRSISGNAGCNRYSGQVGTDGNSLIFSRLSSTRMACEGPGMTAEAQFMNLLADKTLAYRLEDDKLTLLENGSAVMVFRKTR